MTNKSNEAGYAYCIIVVYVASIIANKIKKKSNQIIADDGRRNTISMV